MIVNKTRTQNFSAVSAVNVSEGTGDVVLIMNASVNANGDISFSKQYKNVTLYEQHKKEVDKDYADFEEMVINSVIGE